MMMSMMSMILMMYFFDIDDEYDIDDDVVL